MIEIGRISLLRAGGEPVDLWRTVRSHGVASLPPMALDETARTFTVTLRLPGGFDGLAGDRSQRRPRDLPHGHRGHRSTGTPKEGMRVAIQPATLPGVGPNGPFFEADGPLPW